MLSNAFAIALLFTLSFLDGVRMFQPFRTSTRNYQVRNATGFYDSEYFRRAGPWDEKDLNSLLDANKAWAKRVEEQHPNLFEEIKKGHAPKILWIGCSDARVPANEIIGEPPGSVFVHRNIANQVGSNDVNCLSVIQYAVDVLKVKHIIVCGHYDCGGIRASTESKDHGSPLENWLRNIRDVYRLHRDELDKLSDPVKRQKRLVELNVIEQVSWNLKNYWFDIFLSDFDMNSA